MTSTHLMIDLNDTPFIATVLPSLERTFPGMLADLDFYFTAYGKMPVMFVRLYWHSSVGANTSMPAEWGRN
jgi:hypothetical protein